jgi:hypothetical protein
VPTMSVAIKPMTRPIAKADHHRTIFIRRKMMKAGTARTAVKVTAPKYHANIVAKVENSCSLNVPLSMGVTMMTIKAVTRGAKTKAVTSELPPIFQTPRLGAMMISEVWDGKAKFHSGVQARGS